MHKYRIYSGIASFLEFFEWNIAVELCFLYISCQATLSAYLLPLSCIRFYVHRSIWNSAYRIIFQEENKYKNLWTIWKKRMGAICTSSISLNMNIFWSQNHGEFILFQTIWISFFFVSLCCKLKKEMRKKYCKVNKVKSIQQTIYTGIC